MVVDRTKDADRIEEVLILSIVIVLMGEYGWISHYITKIKRKIKKWMQSLTYTIY